DEQPHEFAADGCLPEELRQLWQVEQPVRVPRSPVGIVAVHDPVDKMVCLAGLVQQRGDLFGAISHERSSRGRPCRYTRRAAGAEISCDAKAVAASSASIQFRRSLSARTRPALNASPAPVVSPTSTSGAGTDCEK